MMTLVSRTDRRKDEGDHEMYDFTITPISATRTVVRIYEINDQDERLVLTVPMADYAVALAAAPSIVAAYTAAAAPARPIATLATAIRGSGVVS